MSRQVDRSALQGQVFAAVYTVLKCSAKINGAADVARRARAPAKPCKSYELHRCPHDKIETLELRFYDAIGPAKSYVTQKRNATPIGQTEEQAFVLVGEIADMIKLGADAQARYEHEETRTLAHGAAADRARIEAARAETPRKRKKT